MFPAVVAMRPLFVEKPWGGTRMRSLPAKMRRGHAPHTDAPVGEAWEVADLDEGASTIDGGPWDGRSLREFVATHGADVAGATAAASARGAVRFPLLVKLIDAAEDLSIQVHPGEGYAQSHPGTWAKDESWLVVDSAVGARVLHGFKDGVSREAFERALREGRPDQLLREVPIQAGDVFRVRPGTFHAVGGGSLLLEVQQPSDTTFRVWDWGRRVGGAERPLHIREALEVGNFGPQDEARMGTAGTNPSRTTALPVTAVRTAHYQMSVHELASEVPFTVPRPLHEPAVVFALDGDVSIVATSRDGDSNVILPRGGTALVCAAAHVACVHAHGLSRVAVLTTGETS